MFLAVSSEAILGFWRSRYSKGREVERLNLVARFAEKSAFGLVAEQLVDHLLQNVGQRERLALLVVRQTGVKVLRYVNGGVQSDDIERAERRALAWPMTVPVIVDLSVV